MVSMGQKLKMPKRCEKVLYDYNKLVGCIKPLQNTSNFEKRQDFKNGRKLPRCMGYSLCKIVSLGQKLKIPKRCEKRLYDHIKLDVCKKPLQKTPNISKMTPF